MQLTKIQNATDTLRPPSTDRRLPQWINSRQSPSLDSHHHASIDNRLAASIDTNQSRSHIIKFQPNFHNREEIDQLVEGIYRVLETTEERLDGRCDDIYFPMDLTISALTSKVEAIQGELVDIQSYIARRPKATHQRTEEEEVVDNEGEEDVNYIGGTGFQRSGNQGGNINYFGNDQRSNQSSQFQKPFSNNSRGYGNSYYQNPPPQTQKNKIEAMLDRVLEGQQQFIVDFNGKIDSAYNSLNTRIETLRTQIRKLEMQVTQTRNTVKRQETLARKAGVEKAKHHVNAIIP
ncbi:hypothetical protein IGI04_015362 [Brassica rapa subsp. trilocularis]|uniref:t-SNARE coiled-coil homology domain-containing protein n=1 Tax=Brassica rapa subsp. trilocularis TaxID=1813537 RepID=A0ABQ7MPV5_BRACM|nr:hypothetical protein IGI04_015362 [Brassica rapa subsp. trilocularis]